MKKEKYKNQLNSGITLVALVITIIVLLILAGIAISLVLGENGIITKSMESGKVHELASMKEQIQMEILGRIDNNLSVSYEDIEEILQKYAGDNGEVVYEDVDKTIPIGVHPNQYPEEEILLKDVWNGNINELGSEEGFDSTKGVNKPKIVTGMKPVKFVGVTPTNTTETDSEWYDYGLNTAGFGQNNTNNRKAKWANATTQNGSYFVWIPRYAYKIVSGEHTSNAGEIDIIFLQGITNRDKNGRKIPSDYIVHPAFDFGGAKTRNLGRKI